MADYMIPVAMPTWVKFLGEGGYPSERKKACEALEIGAEYVILRMEVGRSSSTVDIADEHGRPMGNYNTAMFEFLAFGLDLEDE